jgi:hypothetical protein
MSSASRRFAVWVAAASLVASLADVTWGQGPEFEVSDVFFELNDTDGDLGIHALIDGDDWRTLAIEDPNGRQNLVISLGGGMRRQGLTELFFESAEPNFDDLSPAQFLRRFPEGEYLVRAVTLEGEVFQSLDDVSHLIPAPPGNVEVNGRPLPVNCDAEPLPMVSEPFMVSWDEVETSHPRIGTRNEPIEVVKYQAVLENDDETVVFTFDLPPDMTEVEIPAGFADSGDVLKVEVLVKEESGNQTGVESCFEVR